MHTKFKNKREREKAKDLEKPKKKGRGELIKNSNLIKELKIRPDEDYGEIFHLKTSRVPKRKRKHIV